MLPIVTPSSINDAFEYIIKPSIIQKNFTDCFYCVDNNICTITGYTFDGFEVELASMNLENYSDIEEFAIKFFELINERESLPINIESNRHLTFINEFIKQLNSQTPNNTPFDFFYFTAEKSNKLKFFGLTDQNEEKFICEISLRELESSSEDAFSEFFYQNLTLFFKPDSRQFNLDVALSYVNKELLSGMFKCFYYQFKNEGCQFFGCTYEKDISLFTISLSSFDSDAEFVEYFRKKIESYLQSNASSNLTRKKNLNIDNGSLTTVEVILIPTPSLEELPGIKYALEYYSKEAFIIFLSCLNSIMKSQNWDIAISSFKIGIKGYFVFLIDAHGNQFEYDETYLCSCNTMFKIKESIFEMLVKNFPETSILKERYQVLEKSLIEKALAR